MVICSRILKSETWNYSPKIQNSQLTQFLVIFPGKCLFFEKVGENLERVLRLSFKLSASNSLLVKLVQAVHVYNRQQSRPVILKLLEKRLSWSSRVSPSNIFGNHLGNMFDVKLHDMPPAPKP